MTAAMTAVTGLSVRASRTKNAPPRKPPICGMKLVSIDQIPAMGASGTPRTRPAVRMTSPFSTATRSEPAK